MGLWWPLTADDGLVCAAQSPRARIHAAAFLEQMVGERPDRRPAELLLTVCGLHARAHAVGVVGRPGDGVVCTWPAPIADRCEDCARLTGIGGRMRKGSATFQNLIPIAPGPGA